MAAPLSFHPIRPHFSLDNSTFRNPTSAATASAMAITTNSKVATNNNPIQAHTCLALLEKCSDMSQLKQVHAHMLRTDLFFDAFVAAKIVAFCALDEDSGSLPYARLVLAQIPNPTTYTCNSIIRGYTNRGLALEAILFYREMIFRGLEPDRFTFPSLFKSCGDLLEGKQLHCQSTKLGLASDSYIQNTLVSMYSNCGCLVSARKVFDKMVGRTVVSWATMIGAYAHWDQPSEAVELFDRMMTSDDVRANEVAMVNVLVACAKARDLETAKRMHNYAYQNGFASHVVNTALMDVYCKCGCVSLARDLFDKMLEKNLFCWNIMINGYVEDGDYEEALLLFREMQLKGEKGDQVTMVSLLLACIHLGALDLGKWLHAYVKRGEIEVDVTLGTTLVDMYAKCGGIESALQVFQELPEKDVMTWTALISGLATNGEGEMALKYFHEMKINGLKPDAVTFVGVLTACSQAGLIEEGISHFYSISSRYGLQPSVEHYGCMVDLLGRAGRIAEAEELIQLMPMAPDHSVLGGLLRACRIHGNLEVAERAAQQLLELDPENEGTYVLLSNMYSSFKKWKEAKRIRHLMAERNISKSLDCCRIEVGGFLHEFVKGNSSHPETTKINQMLDDINSKLKKAGYVPEKSEVLSEPDEDEENETALGLHSERLAIAFGLLSTSPGTPIRVSKNLRICTDCHTATKLISKFYNREIVVRNRNRFHRFKYGSCSCKDFW